jgi:ketosteroid isomerase-like protein
MVTFDAMKAFALVLFLLTTVTATFAQDHAQAIFDTERAFEKAVADKGIKDGFIEFLSPVGVMFRPEPVNGRAWWMTRTKSPAALTWNPVKIEVSSNGALAYSIGNSIYKPKGSTDNEESHGHYLSVWTRQSDGKYFAALDAGISHPKPSQLEPTWTPGPVKPEEPNPKRLFAGDSSIAFFRMAEDRGLAKAYKAYAAEDIILMRDEKFPFVGRDAAVRFIDDQPNTITFVKRRSFVEAGDLGYVFSAYTLFDKKGTEVEKGHFVQVWKLRNGKWQIAADLFIPIPAPKS